MSHEQKQRWHVAAPWLVFAVALLAQFPLALNPGYFSHDELQWAVRAGMTHPVAWLGVDAFQYRPLTFNLWMWLSRHLFAQPQAFHTVIVAWGAANAALLFALGRKFGVGAWPAAFGALLFALGPFAAYTHGWVGTIADLAWLSAALLIGLHLLRRPATMSAIAVTALLTGLGLLAKEAAFAIPALLAVAWWFSGRKRIWAVAAVSAGTVAAVYLAVRAGVLLHVPREGTQYTLSLAHVPLRWLEYQLFAPIPTVFETFNTLSRGMNSRIVIAALLWLALLAALWRSDKRLPWLFLAGGFAALLPVLPLGSSWNHYGYGFAAVTAMIVAAAWRPASRWARVMIALMALLTLWHGVNVTRQMRAVGAVQAVFSPALADVLRDRATRDPLRLRPSADAAGWMFRRLTHNIPSYAGIPIGDRVHMVAPDQPADLIIQADGRLRAPP